METADLQPFFWLQFPLESCFVDGVNFTTGEAEKNTQYEKLQPPKAARLSVYPHKTNLMSMDVKTKRKGPPAASLTEWGNFRGQFEKMGNLYRRPRLGV